MKLFKVSVEGHYRVILGSKGSYKGHYNENFKGAALVASAQAGFVESGLDAMRDSSFLGEADRKIIADQQRMVQTGNKGERMHIHIEANGECDSDFPTFDGTCVREDNKFGFYSFFESYFCL